MKKSTIDFERTGGLVPAIIQDYKTNEVYMLGYMNPEALQSTIDTGNVYFWSRSKQRLWMKGEESGNVLAVKEMHVDCDLDTVLVKAKLDGTCVCHTGNTTCFFKELQMKENL